MAFAVPPEEDAADLLVRWCDAAAGLRGTADAAAIRAAGSALLRRWGQAHRRYHDLTHLREVLDAVEVLAGFARDADVVRAAAWFHDAVYAGRPGDDERDSAALAATTLAGLGVPAATAQEVARLVLLTATHSPQPGDADGAVLCDADLAVLAADPARYGAYATAVRAEYAHVGEQAFRIGRAGVLRALTSGPAVYRTEKAFELWEAAARRNVADELRRLDASG